MQYINFCGGLHTKSIQHLLPEHHQVVLGGLVLHQRGGQLPDKDEQWNHWKNNHCQGVDQLASVRAEVQGIKPSNHQSSI